MEQSILETVIRKIPTHHRTVWIDICNSPHVLFFEPIIGELQKRGIDLLVTAQDFGQTVALLNMRKIPFTIVGGQTGKGLLSKISENLRRSVGLAARIRADRPAIMVSHGSRSAVIAAWMLGVPSITIDDFEHSFTRLNNTLSWLLLFPSIIPHTALRRAGIPVGKVKQYPGFKEEVYISGFQGPEPIDFTELGIDPSEIIVLLRPPATTAHYHTSQADFLYGKIVDYLGRQEGVRTIVLGRNPAQQAELKASVGKMRGFTVPDCVFEGLSLLSQVDVMIGGGGTMNREAAIIGTPTYSFFAGPRPAVDSALEHTGKMHFIRTEDDVNSIHLQKKRRNGDHGSATRSGLEFIVNEIQLALGGGAQDA